MARKTKVVFADTAGGIAPAIREIFSHTGSVPFGESRDVYLKVNAVDLREYCYTDPEVIRQVIVYFREAGARNIYVIENCTQGNFTRLVFKGTGIDTVCRETGAVPVYLDETGAVPVYLEGLESFVDISSFVYERLILDRQKNLYVSLPKLKTHSMSQVTLSIKNQFGFVHQASRIADHNFRLHQKFADIYRVLRPDFVIVDALIATNHGHYIAKRYADECIVKTDCLIGGVDPLAVDVVAASFLGFGIRQVPHLELSAKTGIGQGAQGSIEIVNRKLYNERKTRLTHQLLDRFPTDLTILRGPRRCCPEGCRRNTETVVEVLHADHGGRGGFTILMGKGINEAQVDRITGPVHLAGSCAIEEHGMRLLRRLGAKNVTMSPGCNNLAATIHGICRHMGVSPLSLARVNPASSLSALLAARIKGSRAIITPIF